jgi:dUTP pyrophosphatase
MLKIKLIDKNALAPTRALSGDAGFDVYAPKAFSIQPGKDAIISLGWACEFPAGYAMVMLDKSGRSVNDKLHCAAPLIDSNYRGEVHVQLYNFSDKLIWIQQHEKVAQFILIPIFNGYATVVDELNNDTERGEGRFGSTGK